MINLGHSQIILLLTSIFLWISMGEAKRRRELGLPPKSKKEKKTRTNEKLFSWSQVSINKLKNQYPAAPFVATALVLIVLQLGFSLNS